MSRNCGTTYQVCTILQVVDLCYLEGDKQLNIITAVHWSIWTNFPTDESFAQWPILSQRQVTVYLLLPLLLKYGVIYFLIGFLTKYRSEVGEVSGAYSVCKCIISLSCKEYGMYLFMLYWVSVALFVIRNMFRLLISAWKSKCILFAVSRASEL